MQHSSAIRIGQLAEEAATDTVVLIRGLWMTPLSWEHWVTHYENRGPC